jgi:hypothetical protein
MIYFDALSRESGDGSRSTEADWMDENTRVSDNKWTSSRTTFWTEGTDGNGNTLNKSQRDKYKRLRKIHDRFAGDNETYNRKTTIRYGHIMNDVYTFCNLCSLREQQTESVSNIIRETDISSNNYGGKSYEVIILAVMSLIVDRDIDSVEDMDKRLLLTDSFRNLMDSNEVGSSELRTVRQMVRERVDLEKW